MLRLQMTAHSRKRNGTVRLSLSARAFGVRGHGPRANCEGRSAKLPEWRDECGAPVCLPIAVECLVICEERLEGREVKYGIWDVAFIIYGKSSAEEMHFAFSCFLSQLKLILPEFHSTLLSMLSQTVCKPWHPLTVNANFERFFFFSPTPEV